MSLLMRDGKIKSVENWAKQDNEHARLERAVVEAAKAWANGRIVNAFDDGVLLVNAVDALEEFERTTGAD